MMKDKYHWFMFSDRKGPSFHLRKLVKMREEIESFPVYKRTFALRYLDVRNTWRRMKNMAYVCGAYMTCKHGPSENSVGDRFICPNYKHSEPAVTAKCKCGAVISDGCGTCVNGDGHNSNCRPGWPKETKKRLMLLRHGFIKKMAWYGWTNKEIGDSIMYPGDHISDAVPSADFTNQDLVGMRKNTLARTFEKLLRYCSPKLIGRAYDIPRSTLKDYVSKRTDSEPNELAMYRNGYNNA